MISTMYSTLLKFIYTSIGFKYRFIIFLLHVIAIIVISDFKRLLNTIKNNQGRRVYVIQPMGHKINHINRENLRYRIKIIGSTYFIASINSIIFESMTFFPLGWLLNGVIILIMENICSCLTKILPNVFKESREKIETYRLLYKMRHVVNVLLMWSFVEFFILGLVMVYVFENVYV
jgi:hypothetical protein